MASLNKHYNIHLVSSYRLKGRKGVFSSIDAFIGSAIILAALIFATTFYGSERVYDDHSYVSQDVAEVMSNLMMGEINDTYVDYLMTSGQLLELNKSAVRTIGEFWATNNSAVAANITKIIIGNLLSNQTFSISLDNNMLVSGNATASYSGLEFGTIKSSRRIISGITEGKPITGVSSRVFLKYVRDKKNFAYVYFGGFVGQGNVTESIVLPENITVSDLYLELAASSQFNLYINNNSCMGLFHPRDINMSADAWNISTCTPFINITPGVRNFFDIRFPNSTLQDQYVGGGMIRITYLTDMLTENIDFNGTIDWLSGVNGIVNTYSSFFVPGTLDNMEIRLHYFANHTPIENATFYMTIGNQMIHSDVNSTSVQTVIFSNATLASMLDFSTLGQGTIPIRIGFMNFTYETVEVGGNADVILITDQSGSMDWCLNGAHSGCTVVNGTNPERWALAKVLDKQFINLVTAVPGNRVGLVTYSYQAVNRHALSSNNVSLVNSVNSWAAPSGGTCIGCAIRQARLMLQSQSNQSRDQFIIVMTDGIGNLRTDMTNLNRVRCCTNGGSGCNNPTCGNGQYSSATCGDTLDDTAKSRAITDSCYARNMTNATLHSVGFGSGAAACAYATDFLQQIANCGNGTTYISTNVTGLTDIYSAIATELVISSTVSQTIMIEGNPQVSAIYPDSYIMTNFSRNEPPAEFGEIAITFESPSFTSCTPQVNIPSQLRLVESRATSYSGQHWTDLIQANNNTAFDLSSYGSVYQTLGDPYVIDVPANFLLGGVNSLFFRTGDEPINSTGCSLNNSFIYTGMVSSSVPYTQPLELADGCSWQVSFDDGSSVTIPAPAGYNGTDSCVFSNALVDFDPNDAVDIAMYSLLNQFDFDDDNRSDLNFGQADFEIVITSIGEVPFLWGPAIFEVNVWR